MNSKFHFLATGQCQLEGFHHDNSVRVGATDTEIGKENSTKIETEKKHRCVEVEVFFHYFDVTQKVVTLLGPRPRQKIENRFEDVHRDKKKI